jgi:RHS repeat-associated protein
MLSVIGKYAFEYFAGVSQIASEATPTPTSTTAMPSFPFTGILDNFNRSNNNDASTGSAQVLDSTRYLSGVLPTDKVQKRSFCLAEWHAVPFCTYTGQRLSRDISLYDYRARWYDPLLGRFLMEDTIIPNQGVMRLDRYSGMRNNPVLFTDPFGKDICDEEGNCWEQGKKVRGIRINNPVQYVGMDEEAVKILITLIVMESSSGNVPDYVNYQKAWALLNLRSYNISKKPRDPELLNWRNHESELLNYLGITGTAEEQEVALLNWYEDYQRDEIPGISKEEFQAIEAQVRKAAIASYTYGWNSDFDPVRGATGFRDAAGCYYPSGRAEETHLKDLSKNEYANIVTNEVEMERFRGIFSPGQVVSQLYPYTWDAKRSKWFFTFTVFHGPYR